MTPSKSTAPPSKEIAYFGSELSSNSVSKAESTSKASAGVISIEHLSRPTTATKYNLFIGSSSRNSNTGSNEVDTGRPQGFAIFNSAEINPSTGSNEMYNSLLFKPPIFGGSKTNQATELRAPNSETNNVNNKSPPRPPDIRSSDVRKYQNLEHHGSDKTNKGPSPNLIKLGSHTRFPAHSLERPHSSNSKFPPKSSDQGLHVPRQNGSPPTLRHGQLQNPQNPPQSNQESSPNSVNQARPPPSGPDPGSSPSSPNSRFPTGSSIPRTPTNPGSPPSGPVPGPSPSSPNSIFLPGSPIQRPTANPGSPPSGPDPGPSPSSPYSILPPGPSANPGPPPTTPHPGSPINSQRSESPTKLPSTPQRPSSELPPGSPWNHPNPGSPKSDSSNNSPKPGSTTQPPDPGSAENGVPPGPRYPGSGVIVRLSASHSSEVSSEEDFRNPPSSQEDENKDKTTRTGIHTTAPPSENGVHTTVTPSDRVTSKPPPASSTRKEVTVLYRPVGLLNVSFVQFNRHNNPPTSPPRSTGTTSKPSTTTQSYIQSK